MVFFIVIVVISVAQMKFSSSKEEQHKEAPECGEICNLEILRVY